MAVANTWATGHSTVSVSQFRPSLTSPYPVDCCIAKKCWGLSLGSSKRAVFKNRRNSKLLLCQCTATSNSDGFGNNEGSTFNPSTFLSSSSEWDWNRWTRHFSEIEQVENYTSVLKFQLDEAIEKEDFQEAAKLKAAITEATSKDNIAQIMSQLTNAINTENYHEASSLCKKTGSGLVGWWVGCSKDSDDPFGRLIQITPGMGRFVARSYTPRQLINGSPGTPVFEIFVVKDTDEEYNMQVVCLHRAKGSRSNSAPSHSNSTKGSSPAVIENASVADVQVNEHKADKNDEKNINFEEATEEVIKSMINYFKDKIPELKVNVVSINATEEAVEDVDSAKQLMEENNENVKSGENFEDSVSSLDDIQPDQVNLEGDNNVRENGKDSNTKLFIGGVLHNQEDTPPKDDYVRVSADIEDLEKDSFLLHIPVRSQDRDSGKSLAPKVKMAAIASKGISELMPVDVAKAFWNSDKVSSKVSSDVREFVKLAVSHAQKREKLSEFTRFSRVTPPNGDLDPFEGWHAPVHVFNFNQKKGKNWKPYVYALGLYVGAFGPYGTEVVQLRRKYGNWNSDKTSDMDFFEYVEAVKLTGDLNVPSGEVTFRAKIGKGKRLSNRAMYPEELGVVASYKGQGRIAEFGFRNPKWVEGELLQLNGKGIGPYVKGADLGFLYVVPEQSFLVLFNRLRLPS